MQNNSQRALIEPELLDSNTSPRGAADYWSIAERPRLWTINRQRRSMDRSGLSSSGTPWDYWLRLDASNSGPAGAVFFSGVLQKNARFGRSHRVDDSSATLRLTPR